MVDVCDFDSILQEYVIRKTSIHQKNISALQIMSKAMELHQATHYPTHNTLYGYFSDIYRTLGNILNSKNLKLTGC